MQEQVLDYWFSTPGGGPVDDLARMRRWFMGGSEVDEDVRLRFADTVEAALRGQLDHWTVTPRGRLALVLCLDQFTRNIFRGTPRAWSGDPVALAHSVAAYDGGEQAGLSLDERVFLAMPMLHAEQVAMVERFAGLARGWVVEAPVAEQKGRQMSVEQAEKYRDILKRFGRYPFRNAALGRLSTQDELAFLETWAAQARPSGAS
jgi:uncharacterized protein (DUF924 family)